MVLFQTPPNPVTISEDLLLENCGRPCNPPNLVDYSSKKTLFLENCSYSKPLELTISEGSTLLLSELRGLASREVMEAHSKPTKMDYL
ncbi:hypothetical protein NPIL_457621 [Nephila pilipes]|uniref:Uncharacterized protein n=1 Tax=Nephila pilipes TaxID=299642 RepID=A0A8X6QNY8_NEPPI|nr:hypothetical protein NPIL_457621 [Nephila pilipes]